MKEIPRYSVNLVNLDLRTQQTLDLSASSRDTDGRSKPRVRERMDSSSPIMNGSLTDGSESVDSTNSVAHQVPMAGRNSGTPRPGKRPVKNMSPKEKIHAIRRVTDGESKASVARDIGVPESTLRGWCKSEQKILSQCNNAHPNDMMARHSPGLNGRHSASGRLSANSRISNISQQSSISAIDDEATCAKRFKPQDHNISHGSPQPGPSTSGYVMGKDPYLTFSNEHQIAAALLGAKNLFMTSGMASRAGTVGLVENGLQYRNNSVMPTMVNAGSSITSAINGLPIDISTLTALAAHNRISSMGNLIDHNIVNNMAIAPTQMPRASKKSPSVSPAAEAPSTHVPASPNENNAQPQPQSKSKAKAKARASSSKSRSRASPDDRFRFFLVQQMMLSQPERYPEISLPAKGWFRHWVKHCSSLIQNIRNPQQEELDLARNTLDNLFAKWRETAVTTNEPTMDDDEFDEFYCDVNITQAIEHAERLFEWLCDCSIPTISKFQVIQFKRLLDLIKSGEEGQAQRDGQNKSPELTQQDDKKV